MSIEEERSIPASTFRIEPGYTLNQTLKSEEFKGSNLIVGKTISAQNTEAVFIGKMAEYQNNKNVWLDNQGAHAIYVIGKRRSGKTYTLGVLAESLASDNWLRQGDNRQAILLIDTMNVFLTMPHHIHDIYKETNVKLKEMRKWGLEKETLDVVLYYPKGTERPEEGVSREITIKPADLSGEDWAALFEVDTFTDPIGQLVAEIYDKVAIEGYLDNNGLQVEAKEQYSIPDLLSCLNLCPDVQRYEQKTIEATRRRLKAIGRLPLFSPTGVNMHEVFSPGRVSVLLLRDLDDNIRSLLVAVLTKRIMQLRSISDRFERLASVQYSKLQSVKDGSDLKVIEEVKKKYEEYQKRSLEGLPRGWVIIDEAHNYMPTKSIMPSSAPLKKYVNEGRNLGLSIVAATQNPSALDQSIRRNADLLIIHSISMKDDIAAAEGMLNTLIPDSFDFGRERITTRVFEQLIRSLPSGYAVISSDTLNRVIVVKVRPRFTVHGGTDY